MLKQSQRNAFLFYGRVTEEELIINKLNTCLWSFTKSAFRAVHLTLVALISTSHKSSSTLGNILALRKSF